MADPTSVATTAAKAVSAAAKFRPWATVKRHDRLVLEEYEDLITWARDDLREEAKALDAVSEDLNKRNLFYSGYHGKALMEVRDGFARRWRDRKRAAERKFASLREEESASIRLWRKIARKPWPENPYEEELRSITAGWESEELRRAAVARTIAPRS